jgi:tetratricopeptide (TPR) repeat protein
VGESVKAYAPGAYVAGRYRVEEELGRGGMGAAYRVYDAGACRNVALKLLQSDNPKLIELFEREYRTLSKLRHPRVISVFDYGLTDNAERYYTMELLSGSDLLARMPLPWRATCGALRDVCSSLALLHAQRLVHRDVTPRNIRIDQFGRAKLLDFGTLATFGAPVELVGTPSFTAPESVRGEALEARADLFALGVVAYLALTARRPFAIRSFADSEVAWRTVPIAPSRLVASVPSALDELVLSLLSIDPMGRPRSAAEVIDRLDVIATTDDEPMSMLAESHITSAPWVGRSAEQKTIDDLLASREPGRGRQLNIQGEAGTGKTRFLAELRIEAHLRGFLCVGMHGAESGAARNVSRELQRGLREVAPRLSREHVYETSDEAALLEHLSVVARSKPLLLTIDDAHALDPDQRTLLQRVADKVPLTLVLTEDAMAGQRLEGPSLGPLDLAAIEEFVNAIVGDVPHRPRITQWLWSESRGNPGLMHALLLTLLSKQIIRLSGGVWLLPAQINSVASPDLGVTRVADLDPLTRQLAAMLAIHHGSLPEPVLYRAMGAHGSDAVRASLSQLEHSHIIVRRDSSCRFIHERVRGELFEALGDEPSRGLHTSLSRALRAHQPSTLAAIESSDFTRLSASEIVYGVSVGYHLLCGGDEASGVALLDAGAVELTKRGESLPRVVIELEAAVEVLRARGRNPYDYAALTIALTLAGTYVDFRLSYRYGDQMLGILTDLTGVDLARTLAPRLGGKMGLALGLAGGLLRSFVAPPLSIARRSYKELMLGLVGLATAVLGVCSVLHDTVRARAIADKLRPLAYFPDGHAVRMVHEFQLALVDHALGQFAEAKDRYAQVLAFLRSTRALRSMPESARVQLESGVLLGLGQLDAMRADGSAQRTLEALEILDGPTSKQALAAARVAFHGHRGDYGQFVSALEDMDRLAVAAGSIWRNDVSIPRMLWSTFMLCEDVMALKRAADQLRTIANQAPSVATLRDIVHACYLCERGMPEEALSRYEVVLEQASNEPGLRGLQVLGAYARMLRKANQPEKAIAACELARSRVSAAEREFEVITFTFDSEHARSIAAAGDLRRAEQLGDELVRRHQFHDNALLCGLAHEVRAQIARLTLDWPTVDSHLEAMERCSQSIQHPTLTAQWMRLHESARAERARALSLAPAAANDLNVIATELADDTPTATADRS